MASSEIKTELMDVDGEQQICRLCMSEESLESVFEEDGLQQWISDFLSIVVSTEDCISQSICAICRIRLTEFHQYRTRCQEVQSILQAMVPDQGKSSEPQTGDATSSSPPIQCDVCHKVFLVQRQLTDHKRVHKPKYVCKWCSKSFVERKRLERHIEETHEEEIWRELESNEKRQTVEDIGEMKTEPPEEGDCAAGVQEPGGDESGRIDISSGNTEKEELEQRVKLEYDAEGSSFIHNLDVEVRNTAEVDMRGFGVVDMVVVEEVKVEAPNNDEEEQYAPEESESTVVGVTETVVATSKRKNKSEDEQLECEKCKKMCKNRQALSSHLNVVHGPRKFPCLFCGVRFATKNDFNYHCRSNKHLRKKKEKEAEESIYTDMQKSNIDDIKGSTENTFKAHTQSVKNELPLPAESDVLKQSSNDTTDNGNRYSCSKCNCSFNRECQFIGHMKIHDENVRDKDDDDLFKTDEDDLDYGTHIPSNFKYVERPDGKKQLKCDLCNKTFRVDRKKLVDHNRLIHGPKNHLCPICDKPFAMRYSMEKHKLTHQPKPKRPVKTAEEANSVARPFECDVCHKTFTRRRALMDHKKYIHGPKNYECEICGFRFSMQSALDLHMRRHVRYRDSREDFLQFHEMLQEEKESSNGESTQLSNQNFGETSQKESKDDDVKTECKMCNRVFPDKRGLWQHYKYAHKKKLKCSMCNVTFATNKRLVIHLSTKHKKEDGSYQPLKCDECNKVFSTTSQFTAHKLIHGPRIYCCKLCPRDFSRLQHLKSHMKSHEDVGDDFMVPARIREGYECEICHKVMQLKKHMQSHIRRVHGAELHECSICSRLFKKQEELELHMKSHDDAAEQKEGESSGGLGKDVQNLKDSEKTANHPSRLTSTVVSNPDVSTKKSDTVTLISDSEQSTEVECGECHKRFLSSKHLYNHIRNVHDPKKYVCSYCGKAFVSRQFLLRHEPTHKNDNQPLYCEKCNKHFPTWRKTYLHLRTHGPKKFKCNLCDKGYAQRSHLASHMKSHEKHGTTQQSSTNTSANQSENESETSQEASRTSTKTNPTRQDAEKPPKPSRSIHSCSICSSQFPSRMQFRRHFMTNHQVGTGSSEKFQVQEASTSELDQTGRNEWFNEMELSGAPPKSPVLLIETEEIKIEPE